MVRKVVPDDFYARVMADLAPKPSAADMINQALMGPQLGLMGLSPAGSSQSASGGGQGLPSGGAPATRASTSSAVGGTAGDFEKFVNSIAKQESGGNYKAVNKSSGALGKYQIMPSNIRSWSLSALGRSITPSQFLSNPQLQEQVARAKLQSYYKKYGAAGASQAWYGGPGSVGRNVSGGKGYPSSNQYAAAVTRRMGK